MTNKNKFTEGVKVFLHETLSYNLYDFFIEHTVKSVIDSKDKKRYLIVSNYSYSDGKERIVNETDLYEYDERIHALVGMMLKIVKANIKSNEMLLKLIGQDK